MRGYGGIENEDRDVAGTLCNLAARRQIVCVDIIGDSVLVVKEFVVRGWRGTGAAEVQALPSFGDLNAQLARQHPRRSPGEGV